MPVPAPPRLAVRASGPGDEDEEPAPSPAQALRLTAFPRWYPHHRSHAPRATVIDLSAVQPDFIPWLESGSFVLPDDPPTTSSISERGPGPSSTPTPRKANAVSPGKLEDEDEQDKDQDEEDEVEEEDALPPPTFPALHSRLKELIEKYDGAVFPKLNWSAPRDAAWIVPGATLRCTSPSDIYLLLKSSDFVATDIAQARELYLPASASGSITVDLEAATTAAAQRASSPPLYLVIKQHYAFPTSHEFRCFVHRRRLIALSQRDTATAFPHLQPRDTRRTLRSLIRDFWLQRLDLEPVPLPPEYEHVHAGSSERAGSAHPAPGEADTDANTGTNDGGGQRPPAPTALLRDYVFDVYLTRDMGRVFLVDLAPWGIARTDPLLWSWDELERRSEHWWAAARRRAGPSRAQDAAEERAAGADGVTSGGEESEEDEDEDTQDEDGEPLAPLRILSSDPSPADGAPNSTSAALAHTFSNTPTYAHNMVPADFHALASASAGPGGAGKTLEQLREEWAAAVARAAGGGDDDNDDNDDDDE